MAIPATGAPFFDVPGAAGPGDEQLAAVVGEHVAAADLDGGHRLCDY